MWQAGTRLAKSFSIFEDFFGLKGYKSLILVDHIQVLENEKYTKKSFIAKMLKTFYVGNVAKMLTYSL